MAISISVNDLSLDLEVPDISAIFRSQPFQVVTHLRWKQLDAFYNSTNVLKWSTEVDGEVIERGEVSLLDSRKLPDVINTGMASVSTKGAHVIKVTVSLDSTVLHTSRKYQAYHGAVSLIPIIIVILLAFSSQQTIFALGFGIFVGACLITGSIWEGIKKVFLNYITGSLSNLEHVYIYLFVACFSGIVGVMKKSGGLGGFVAILSKAAKGSKSGQTLTFLSGTLIFFDTYANILAIGSMFRPVTDALCISCEKLAYIVDTTAAIIASLVPISSWIGFESGLIDKELQRLISFNNGIPPKGLPYSGMEVILNSMKYRFYPIFLLFFTPMIILSGREFGPMLIAERKVRVHRRVDGGDGSVEEDSTKAKRYKGGTDAANTPNKDTPLYWFNMIVPLVLIFALILASLSISGDDGSGTLTFSDKLNYANASAAIYASVISVSAFLIPFYSFQLVISGDLIGGHLICPTMSTLRQALQYCYSNPQNQQDSNSSSSSSSKHTKNTKNSHEEENFSANDKEELFVIKPLLTPSEYIEAFIYGMMTVIIPIITLSLAWAVGDVVKDVGTDRYMAQGIADGNTLTVEFLPTLSFCISCIIALATGSSFGTMSIIFPMMVATAWNVETNIELFYATMASVLSGASLGAQISPLSDTTILSSTATNCKIQAHVISQAFYVFFPGMLSIILGTMPMGYGLYPYYVAYILGFIALLLVIFLLGVKVINPTGRFDVFTEMTICCNRYSSLHNLKIETSMFRER